MRQLYNFISTYSFYFFATPSKTMFFFLLMFCIIVSKTDFFTKAVSHSDWTTLTWGKGLDHHKGICLIKNTNKVLFVLENFKVINVGFSFFYILHYAKILVNRCFFNSSIVYT